MSERLLSALRHPALAGIARPFVEGWRAAGVAFRIALVVWALGMIAIPILNWTIGPAALDLAIPFSVIAQGVVVLIALIDAWGAPRALGTALLIAAVTWAAEAVGSATGVPFGAYSYTDKLQPQLLDVPLLIPFAWLMMLPPAWAVARRISGRWGGAAFVLASAAAMTAWDLFLDPQMVGWGLWTWHNGGGYFGIPWVNFAGWMLTAAVVTLLARPRDLPTGPLLIVYAITWFLSWFGLAFFWGLPGPAAAGFVVMGLVLALALARPEEVQR
ncbi:MAG: hypothetical protein Kow00124_29880 [Anaerolineae bacterium]